MTTAKNGDHKRAAVAIAPATIDVTDHTITIVVHDVLGKNASHQSGRFLSPQTKNLRESIRVAVAGLHVSAMFSRLLSSEPPGPLVRYGAWRLDVLGVWPTERNVIKGHPCDVPSCPVGDADAPIPQALDALQHAGILDDDARVVEVRAWNMYRKDVRATVIRLVRVEPDVREREVPTLVRLAEQVPPQAKKPRKAKVKS